MYIMNHNTTDRVSSLYISCGLKDANDGGRCENFSINFNNNQLTNNGDAQTIFTPISLSLDWEYKNITATITNNRLVFSTTNALLYGSGGAATTSIEIVIPDGVYSATSLAVYLQGRLNTTADGVFWRGATAGVQLPMHWVVEYDGGANAFAIAFTQNYRATDGGAETVVPIKITHFRDAGIKFNSTELWGFDPASTDYTIAGAQPYVLVANVRTLVEPKLTLPYQADLKVYNVFRIHSNVAKRFLEKRGGVLTNTDILVEIPVPNNYNNGQTIVYDFAAMGDAWQQAIQSNFDFMTFSIRDIYGNLIALDPECDFQITFKITRIRAAETKDDKLYNIAQYSKFGMI